MGCGLHNFLNVVRIPDGREVTLIHSQIGILRGLQQGLQVFAFVLNCLHAHRIAKGLGSWDPCLGHYLLQFLMHHDPPSQHHEAWPFFVMKDYWSLGA